MKELTTKEKIIIVALDLFSKYGYDGVGMELLAKTVGIKGPSIYAHFKSKEEIFNTIISVMENRYKENFGSVDNVKQIPESVIQFKKETLKRIEFTMLDEQIKKVRRLCAKEQFRNDKIAELTSCHQLTGLQKMYSKILKDMMDKGLVRKDDSELLALELVSPISLMVGIMDRQPERENEIRRKIKKHIDHFVNEYME